MKCIRWPIFGNDVHGFPKRLGNQASTDATLTMWPEETYASRELSSSEGHFFPVYGWCSTITANVHAQRLCRHTEEAVFCDRGSPSSARGCGRPPTHQPGNW